MERELVNATYLRELLEVTEDQQEHDLISQLFERLQVSRDEFLVHFPETISKDSEQVSFQLHKLKNQFANLGCEAVSHLIEDMYQLSRQHQLDEVQNKLEDLRELSDQTFVRLRSELSH